MSPNEEQLRAALRQGEGDRPNVDAVIASVYAKRRARRQTVWAVAGSVAAVVVVGGGITAISVFSHGTSSSSSSGGGAGGGLAATAPPPKSAGARIPSVALACPTVPPEIAPPKTSTGSLFPDGVSDVRVCVYQTGTSDLAGGTEATGPAAQQLISRLENSPAPTQSTACTADLGPTVVIVGRTATGSTPTVVGNLGGCGEITNGQASRLARSVLQGEAAKILKNVTPGLNSPGPGPS